MSHDRRTLRRISNEFGTEFVAHLTVAGVSLNGEVRDYNSLGVSLVIKNKSKMPEKQYIDSLEIFYGSERVCNIDNAKVIRFDHRTGHLILSFKDVQKREVINRSQRASLTFIVQGSVHGTDPYTIDQLLMFRLANISQDGMRLISSKSNRHLTPGLELKDFEITIPGTGNFKVSFKIVNVDEGTGHLRFGCIFISKPLKLQKALEKILITSNTDELPTDGINVEYKKRISKIKKFGNRIRIKRLTSEDDFEKVLKLRFKAYLLADKVEPGQTWKDMKDSYDEHAIVYTAFIGNILAGTIRLVFRPENTRLPFEKYLDYSKINNLDITSCAEVSRFAIDPHFQGTDLFLAMFRKIIFEIGAKHIKYPVCMATNKLLPYYMSIGAVQLADPIPHPTIDSESLTLLWFPPDHVIDSKMSGLGWFFVAKPAVRMLKKFNFVRKPSRGLVQYIKVIWELVSFIWKKKFQRRK